jgi:hypothetical protein
VYFLLGDVLEVVRVLDTGDVELKRVPLPSTFTDIHVYGTHILLNNTNTLHYSLTRHMWVTGIPVKTYGFNDLVLYDPETNTSHSLDGDTYPGRPTIIGYKYVVEGDTVIPLKRELRIIKPGSYRLPDTGIILENNHTSLLIVPEELNIGEKILDNPDPPGLPGLTENGTVFIDPKTVEKTTIHIRGEYVDGSTYMSLFKKNDKYTVYMGVLPVYSLTCTWGGVIRDHVICVKNNTVYTYTKTLETVNKKTLPFNTPPRNVVQKPGTLVLVYGDTVVTVNYDGNLSVNRDTSIGEDVYGDEYMFHVQGDIVRGVRTVIEHTNSVSRVIVPDHELVPLGYGMVGALEKNGVRVLVLRKHGRTVVETRRGTINIYGFETGTGKITVYSTPNRVVSVLIHGVGIKTLRREIVLKGGTIRFSPEPETVSIYVTLSGDRNLFKYISPYVVELNRDIPVPEGGWVKIPSTLRTITVKDRNNICLPRRISVRSGNVTYTCVPQTPVIVIKTYPRIPLTIIVDDNKTRVTTQDGETLIPVSPGLHVLKLVPREKGYTETVLNVTVSRPVTLLEPRLIKYGYIKVQSTGKVSLWVDGNLYGEVVETTIPVSPGTHVLEFKSDHNVIKKQVSVSPGETKEIHVSLKPVNTTHVYTTTTRNVKPKTNRTLLFPLLIVTVSLITLLVVLKYRKKRVHDTTKTG